MNGWPAFALLVVAGGVGAVLRFLLDGMVRARVGASFPWGTAIVNLSGSLALGLLVGLAEHHLDAEWLAILGTGLLGGYTTFSAASVETIRLAQAGRRLHTAAYAIGMLVTCVAAALLGIWLGSLA